MLSYRNSGVPLSPPSTAWTRKVNSHRGAGFTAFNRSVGLHRRHGFPPFTYWYKILIYTKLLFLLLGNRIFSCVPIHGFYTYEWMRSNCQLFLKLQVILKVPDNSWLGNDICFHEHGWYVGALSPGSEIPMWGLIAPITDLTSHHQPTPNPDYASPDSSCSRVISYILLHSSAGRRWSKEYREIQEMY